MWASHMFSISCQCPLGCFTLLSHYYLIVLHFTFYNSLGARDGFTQPIFAKGLTASICKSDKTD